MKLQNLYNKKYRELKTAWGDMKERRANPMAVLNVLFEIRQLIGIANELGYKLHEPNSYRNTSGI